MRRTVKLPFVCLLLFISTLCVVNNSYSQLHFELKTGVNVSKLGKGDRFSWRASWHVGGCSHVILNTKIFLQPELLYSSDSYTDNFNSTQVRRDVNFNYLSVPVLFGYHLSRHLSVVTGPEVSYLLYAGVKNGEFQKQNVTGSYSKYTYGIDGGLNYRIGKRLSIDLRYNYGINVLKQYYINYNDNSVIGYSTFRKRVLQVGLQCNL